MRIKRFVCLLLALTVVCLCGCGSSSGESSTGERGDMVEKKPSPGMTVKTYFGREPATLSIEGGPLFTEMEVRSNKCSVEGLTLWYYAFVAQSEGTFHVLNYMDVEVAGARQGCVVTDDGRIYKNAIYGIDAGYLKLGDLSQATELIPDKENRTLIFADVWKQQQLETLKVNSTATPLAFADVLAEVNGDRADLAAAEALDFAKVERYFVNDPSVAELLTDAEVADLCRQGQSNRQTQFPYDQTVEDIDLLFRALKSSYGAYYYFGGDEVFDAAKENILRQLEEQRDVVSKSKKKGHILFTTFENIIAQELSFIQDAHAFFGQVNGEEVHQHWQYHYTDIVFEQDGADYVTTIDGMRYTYLGCDNEYVTMERVLRPDGTLVYSPVQYAPKDAVETGSDLYLSEGTKETTMMVGWMASSPLSDTPFPTPQFEQGEKNGVSYVAVRAFYGNDNELERFAQSGAALKDTDLLIFDIRSNGGGGDEWCSQWVENFSGQTPHYPQIFSIRESKLMRSYGMQGPDGTPLGEYFLNPVQGEVIENDTLVIVLVDENCGSAGESMLNDLRMMDNVVVVGSGSGGYQLCGNQMGLMLPNSNFPCSFGGTLSFIYNTENVDYKGYAPDIWCDPSTSLDAVLNMVSHYGLK